ncbi:MAG: LysM peptidoglycan-binding domain-containing protein [Firmicutes bacterium]|nr:LysM peptidoglycan-binding domain-containing protein [Bacillota bacterium]
MKDEIAVPTAYFGTLDYTVVSGDTLGQIARDYNSTVANILKFNRIPDPDMIFPGQRIVVPLSPPEAIIYTVNPGDTLYLIARKYGTQVNNLIRFNYLFYPYTIYPGQQLVVTASLR